MSHVETTEKVWKQTEKVPGKPKATGLLKFRASKEKGGQGPQPVESNKNKANRGNGMEKQG